MTMESGRKEIRIAGFGGQGVVLAGIIVGRAGMLAGYQVVQNQSYGAEARGGGARAEVVFAEDPILYPEVLRPDVMVVMSQLACDKYGADLARGGRLIVETELVTALPPGMELGDAFCQADVASSCASGASFTHLAEQRLQKPIVANMIALGFTVGCTRLVDRAHLEAAVDELAPTGTVESNLAAVDAGWQLAAGELAPF
jgi:2-oxoglutarate ferredoxin oxidoreductase subunit gamma